VRTHADGFELECVDRREDSGGVGSQGPEGDWSSSNSEEEGEEDVCFRCGRAGHWQTQCYARTHADGSRL
jgi:hypothetical protein